MKRGQIYKGRYSCCSISILGFITIKKRPALVLVDLNVEDLILSQITSQNIYDSYAIEISENDFEKGNLNRASNIRPNKIFTADEGIILYKVAHLSEEKIQEVTDKIISIFVEG